VRELTAAAAVAELVFTPDGKSLVAVDANQDVSVWEPAAGKTRTTFSVKGGDAGPGGIRSSGSVSPAGTHYVRQQLDPTTANGGLRVHDLATGEAQDIKLGAGGAQAVAFSPDGKYLAWSSFLDGVTVWDIAGHKEVAKFGTEGNKPRFFGQSLRFSDDGKTLAVTMANDAIELWDVASGKHLRTIGGHEVEQSKRVAIRLVLGAGGRLTRSDVAFSPDGKTIAASLGNATVRQFDTATGAEVAATGGHLSGVIAVGSDGRRVVTVSKESVRVWDAAGGREV